MGPRCVQVRITPRLNVKEAFLVEIEGYSLRGLSEFCQQKWSDHLKNNLTQCNELSHFIVLQDKVFWSQLYWLLMGYHEILALQAIVKLWR